MSDNSVMQGEITERLKNAGHDGQRLIETAEAIARLNTEAMLGHRLWTKGIPVPDQLGVSAIVRESFLAEIVAQLTSLRALGTIDIFPYGIPVPEIYEVTGIFGNVGARGEGQL